jgi:hypothetical protein
MSNTEINTNILKEEWKKGKDAIFAQSPSRSLNISLLSISTIIAIALGAYLVISLMYAFILYPLLVKLDNNKSNENRLQRLLSG